MPSRTQMVQLLRLLDQGAYYDETIEAARACCACWPALAEQVQADMRAAGDADSRRARIWSAAWDGGMEHVLSAIDQPAEPDIDLQGTIDDYAESLDDLLGEYRRLDAILLTLIADARLAVHSLRHGTRFAAIDDLEPAIARAESDYHALTMSPGEDIPIEEDANEVLHLPG